MSKVTYERDIDDELLDGGTEDAPVENAGECPLFPQADKRTTRVLDHILVTKTDPPGEGFKGRLAPGADQMQIAVQWGNGHYDLKGCNTKGVELRTHSIQIALSAKQLRSLREAEKLQEHGGEERLPADSNEFARAALQAQFTSHNKEVDRLEAMSNRVNEQVTGQGKEYVQMVTKTNENQMNRDREFYKANSGQMQSFFANMLQQAQQASQDNLQQSQQSHTQAMSLAQENFKQTMVMMTHLQSQAQSQNNPALLISVLMKGLEMGQGMENEDPEWMKALGMGNSMLGNLAMLKSGSTPAMPTIPTPAAAGTAPKGSAAKVLSKEQLKSLIEFKQLCDAKGLPFDTIVQNAKAQVAGHTPENLQEGDEGEYDEYEDEEDEEDENLDPSTNATQDPPTTAKPPGVDGAQSHEQPVTA